MVYQKQIMSNEPEQLIRRVVDLMNPFFSVIRSNWRAWQNVSKLSLVGYRLDSICPMNVVYIKDSISSWKEVMNGIVKSTILASIYLKMTDGLEITFTKFVTIQRCE